MGHTIKLIIGLGNPGKQYETTRHNVGAWFITTIAEQNNLFLKKENKFSTQITAWHHASHSSYLAIPNTFMNLSGQAVYALAHFYRIKPAEILIVHDELDLPTGIARLKFGGGHGGHNGLKDIIQHLTTPLFYRLRLGIGRPGSREEMIDYVLSSPNKLDFQKIQTAIEESIAVLPHILLGEMERAMNQLHTEGKEHGI